MFTFCKLSTNIKDVMHSIYDMNNVIILGIV